MHTPTHSPAESMPSAEPNREPMEAGESEPAEPAESGGYTICINVRGDGTFSVYRDALHENEGAGPEGMPGAGGDRFDQLDTIDRALKAAVTIYKTNPMGPNAEQQAMESTYTAMAQQPR